MRTTQQGGVSSGAARSLHPHLAGAGGSPLAAAAVGAMGKSPLARVSLQFGTSPLRCSRGEAGAEEEGGHVRSKRPMLMVEGEAFEHDDVISSPMVVGDQGRA